MLHPANAEALVREHRNDLLRAAEGDRLAAQIQHSHPLRSRAAATMGHLLLLSGRSLTRYAYAHTKAMTPA